MTKLYNCMVTTRFPTEADLEASKINQLAALINEVYDDAESGMWRRPGTRTNPGIPQSFTVMAGNAVVTGVPGQQNFMPLVLRNPP